MARIIDSRCVLAVRDLQVSTRYYVDVLGFTQDPVEADGWSFLSRDSFSVMLGECPDEKPASELGDHSYFVYLMVDDVDGFHREVAETRRRDQLGTHRQTLGAPRVRPAHTRRTPHHLRPADTQDLTPVRGRAKLGFRRGSSSRSPDTPDVTGYITYRGF